MADPDYIQWLSDQLGWVLKAATEGDGGRVARLIQETGVKYDNQGVYALCCGLAEGIKVLGRFDTDPGSFWGFEVHKLGGGQVAPQDAGQDAGVAGMRFAMAYLNDDPAQQLAVFNADPVATACGLAILVGAEGRSRAAEHKAQVARKAKRRKRRRP